jgi:hypothetical protein
MNKAIRMRMNDGAEALDRAFSKLPTYDGKIGYITHGYHGATAELMPFSPQDAANRYPLGGETRFAGYTSATADPQAALGELGDHFGNDVVVAVKTSRATDLRPVATLPRQSEIVIGRGVPLRTTHVEVNPVAREPGRSRVMAFANTRNSSPVREREVDEMWLRYARGGSASSESLSSGEDVGTMNFARGGGGPSQRGRYWRTQPDTTTEGPPTSPVVKPARPLRFKPG